MSSGKIIAMSNRLRISLVIPVFNEESYLRDCLRSALAQHATFYEIIVVDNNSTDRTAAIARQFPEVKLLHEPRQGVVFARNRGFDAARGDIIARIDADSRLPADWSRHLGQLFSNDQTDAVTGSVHYYDTALAGLLSRSDSFIRRVVARLLGKTMALQGANMAIRRRAWRAVRRDSCARAGVHEDFDLAIHCVEHDLQVRYAPDLRAHVAFRQARSSWRTFASYYWHCPQTYVVHGISRGRWLVPVSLGMIVAYPLLHLLSRGFDTNQQRFSLNQLLTGRMQVRVNPATYVD